MKDTIREGIASARVVDVHAHIRLEKEVGPVGSYGPEHGADADGRPWYRVGNFRLLGVRHSASPFTDPLLRLKRMGEVWQSTFRSFRRAP